MGDKSSKKQDKEARLAEALKANLRRRKAQSRGRKVAPPSDQKDKDDGHGDSSR